MADYVTSTQLKTQLSIPVADTDDDAGLAAAVTAASRAVREYCGRDFSAPSGVTTRVYAPWDDTCIEVDDISTLTGLVVKTDGDDDGAYETTWTVTSEFIAAPSNAIADGEPVTRLAAVGSKAFPVGTMRPTVQVTASFGWTAVPEDVKTATLIKAARLFRRKDTPEGVAGGNDFGVVRISRWEDPDIVMLLAPYVRPGQAVGWGIA